MNEEKMHEISRRDESVDRSGVRALDEAREIGIETLNKLEGQREAIESYEDVVESNQYIVDKSGRIIRGMTWWGWIQNTFTKPPSAPDPRRRSSESVSLPSSSTRSLPIDQKRVFNSGEEIPSMSREQSEYLASLSLGLDDLLQVGSAIGDSTEKQNETLPKLQDKIDTLWETTTHVTRQAGRVHEGYATRAKPVFLCHVAIREKKTGTYITLCPDGELMLLPQKENSISIACRFALHEKRTHLLGLQSTVSNKYIGITFAGTLACRSSSFGRYEEIYIDLSRPLDSPILAIAANWGSGCWLDLRSTLRRSSSAHRKHRNEETSSYKLTIGLPRTSPNALKLAPRFELVFLDDDFDPLYSSGQQLLFRKKKKAREEEIRHTRR